MNDDDTTDQFIFSAGTTIGTRDYLVICRDTVKFRSLHTNNIIILGNTNFGLSSSGERIKLLDNIGNIVDEVTYSSSGLWSSLPNGNGPTLSLINPQLDNSSPQSWQASGLYGTPGYLNDIYTKAENERDLVPSDFVLYRIIQTRLIQIQKLFGKYPLIVGMY